MGEVAVYFVGISAGIALLVSVLLYFGKKATKREEAEALATKAKAVYEYYGDGMLGKEFLWAVWQGQSDFSEMTMRVRDEQDAEITTIHCPNIVVTERRWFEFEDKRYYQNKVPNFSVRMEYCQHGSSQVLYSSKKTFNKTFIYRGNTDDVLYTVLTGSVFSKFSRVMKGKDEIARIIYLEKIGAYSRALSCKTGMLSPLEKLIILTAL